jgi:hypothetical protein
LIKELKMLKKEERRMTAAKSAAAARTTHDGVETGLNYIDEPQEEEEENVYRKRMSKLFRKAGGEDGGGTFEERKTRLKTIMKKSLSLPASKGIKREITQLLD